MQNESADQSRWINLVHTIARLRDPSGGCPWDLEQSHSSLVPFLVEECFELAEAIETGIEDHIVEELGDVLLQVLLHAQLGKDRGAFNIDEVLRTLTEKMVRRHPHVFGSNGGLSTNDVLKAWGEIKAKEKAEANNQPELEIEAPFRFQIPVALPALMRASKMGSKTKKFRFDWPNWRGAFEKVKEELRELEAALEENPEVPESKSPNLEPPGPNRDPVHQEIGDLLFTVAQLARHRGFDPEQCLRESNLRFENRFRRLLKRAEQLETSDGRAFASRSNEEIEQIWQTAKQQARDALEE